METLVAGITLANLLTSFTSWWLLPLTVAFVMSLPYAQKYVADSDLRSKHLLFIQRVLRNRYSALATGFIISTLAVLVATWVLSNAALQPDKPLSWEPDGPFELGRFPASVTVRRIAGHTCPEVHVLAKLKNTTAGEIRLSMLMGSIAIFDRNTGTSLLFGAPAYESGVEANGTTNGSASYNNATPLAPGESTTIQIANTMDQSNTCVSGSSNFVPFSKIDKILVTGPNRRF